MHVDKCSMLAAHILGVVPPCGLVKPYPQVPTRSHIIQDLERQRFRSSNDAGSLAERKIFPALASRSNN
jgi:hypothetical protein